MTKLSSYPEIQKGLKLVRIKRPDLRNARATALRTSVGETQKIDLAKALVGDDEAPALASVISLAMNKKANGCASLHLCVALERHLKLPEGTLYRVVYHTEAENWKALKAAYGLTATPTILQKNEPLPAARQSDGTALADICAQKGFTDAKGKAQVRKLATAVYPKDAKKAEALRKRLAKVLNGTKTLAEREAVEISSVLGIPASTLIGKGWTTSPAPPAEAPKETADVVRAAPATTLPATEPEAGLRVSISVPSLNVDTDVGLSYDPAQRTFHGAHNGSAGRIRKTDNGFVLSVTTEIHLPPESAQALLAILLP